MTIKVLFLGDVVRKNGREAVKKHVPGLIEKHGLDFVIINAENMANGYGVSKETMKEMYAAGANCITLGDHTFDNNDIKDILPMDNKVVRSLNYMSKIDGKGYRLFTLPNGFRLGVISLQLQVFMMQKVDCPFKASRNFMRENRIGTDYDGLVVDVHGEATAEKCCLGHLWDGKASLVVGTHTHIPTADTRIQPRGTAYQTDAGMTGCYDSSIGATYQSSLARFELAGRHRLEGAPGEGTVCGTYIEINEETGLCDKVKAIQVGGVLEQKGIDD